MPSQPRHHVGSAELSLSELSEQPRADNLENAPSDGENADDEEDQTNLPLEGPSFSRSSPSRPSSSKSGTSRSSTSRLSSSRSKPVLGLLSKRLAAEELGPTLKRQKGAFNGAYLDLLNSEIVDAAAQLVHDHHPTDLLASKIGSVSWTSQEKQALFDILPRVGREGVEAIASQIGSKSELEVSHYLAHLQEAASARSHDCSLPMRPIDFPAALEISSQCCDKLEDAADVISLRQDSHEEELQKQRWGQWWNVSAHVASSLDDAVSGITHSTRVSDQPPGFAQLFHLSNWLLLSEQVFLNSCRPESNWRSYDEQRPSMWAIAFEEFHALTVSTIRHLVSAALFISQSRIKSRWRDVRPPKNQVLRKDVDAAVTSLGLSPNSSSFWACCARRLHLDVYDESDPRVQPMSYDHIENLLHHQSGRSGRSNGKISLDLPPQLTDSLNIVNESEGGHSESESGSGRDDYDGQGTEFSGSSSLLQADTISPQVTDPTDETVMHCAGNHSKCNSIEVAAIEAECMEAEHTSIHDQLLASQEELSLWSTLDLRPPDAFASQAARPDLQSGLEPAQAWSRDASSQMEC